MKKSGIVILLLLFFLLGGMRVHAAEESVLPDADGIYSQYGMGDLEQELKQLFPGGGFPVKEMFAAIMRGDVQGCFSYMKEGLANTIAGEAAGLKKVFISILLIGILSALFTHFAGVFENRQVTEISFYMVYLLLVAILLTAFKEAVDVASGLTGSLIVFMKLFLPTYFCVIGLASGSTTAYAYYHMMLFLIYVLETVIASVILPASYGYVFLSIINGLWMEEKLNMLMELLKKGINLLLKVSITIVMGVSIIQSMITPVLDSVKGAAMQKVISVIPGLGNLAGGITEMMLGSAVLIKNGIGTLMMVLLIMLCVTPVIRLSAIAVMLKAVAAISGVVADKRLTNCTDHFGDGSILLLRSVLTVAALFMITAAIVSYTTNRGF